MNKTLFTRMFAHAGNILVIAGLVLVVLELHQNREMMRAQIRNELGQEIIDVMGLAAGNKEFAEIIVRANAGEAATPAERIMLDMRSEAVFRYSENVHYQHRAGMYDESEFSKHLATMREVIVNRDKQIAGYWCGNRQFFSDPFRVELDAVLPASVCAPLGAGGSAG